jgi:hypothetical protein
LYKNIKNQFNDYAKKAKFEKRKKSGILDLKKIKYFSTKYSPLDLAGVFLSFNNCSKG